MISYPAAPDVEVLASAFAVPANGFFPINAFVLKGRQPMLVDTGAVVETDDFMDTLRSVIDPGDLQWLWLTHTDFDHVGSLARLLTENPRLRVVTTFLGMGIMSLAAPLPLERLYLVNPGETLDLGDRTLTAVKPPAFDNPSTTGFYDDRSGALFSADCFGALLPAVPNRATDLSESELRDGQVFWAGLDSPWLHKVDRATFAKELDTIRAMEPRMILSSHLPPAASTLTERMLATLASVPEAAPFAGPDQAAFTQLLQDLAQDASSSDPAA